MRYQGINFIVNCVAMTREEAYKHKPHNLNTTLDIELNFQICQELEVITLGKSYQK